nr:MAG TPA: hypothetical protein [Caudoviricetes sp.]
MLHSSKPRLAGLRPAGHVNLNYFKSILLA